MANKWGNYGNSEWFYFLLLLVIADGSCSHEIKRCLLLERKTMINLDSILRSRDITLSTKVHLVKAMVFPSNHIWVWELDHKECWAPNNWCFQIVVLEKTLESPLDSKESKPVHPKENQPWIFTGRTDAEAEALVLWSPDVKNKLWKRPQLRRRLKVAGEGNDKGWDGWMASWTQWTLVWANSSRWWRTGSQRARHYWVTEQ